MATSSSSRSSQSAGLHRSHNPDDRFSPFSSPYHHRSSPSSAFASSSFSARSHSILHRSASPTRVNLVGTGGTNTAVRFSIDSRSVSPHRSLALSSGGKGAPGRKPSHSQPRRTCMCSPTTHPGSFRCALHKNAGTHAMAFPSPSNRLNARRSAMTNSLVRIGTVEGDLVKRALAALIRPSSHQQRRRASFQPRPSRLSVMSRADDGNHV